MRQAGLRGKAAKRWEKTTIPDPHSRPRLGWRAWFPGGVFAVARTAGWIAHALEAYAGGGPLRPRAVCTGPPAIIDP
jgi:hypothetical protein